MEALSPDAPDLLRLLQSNPNGFKNTLDIYRLVYERRERFQHYYKHSGLTIFGDLVLCPVLRWDLEVLIQLKVLEIGEDSLKINQEKLNELIERLR